MNFIQGYFIMSKINCFIGDLKLELHYALCKKNVMICFIEKNWNITFHIRFV